MDEELNFLERSVFKQLVAVADENDRAVITPEEIGAAIGLQRGNVLNATRRLRNNGWLRLSSRRAGPQNKPVYILLRDLPAGDNDLPSIPPLSSVPENTTPIYTSLTVVQETITPERAGELLATNIATNRPIKTHKLAQYASSMRDGNWPLTTDTIKIDRFGRLVDGQHRLFACMQANAKFETLVAYGVDAVAIDYIDQGVPRSIADAVGFHGLKNPNNMVSVSRIILGWRDEVLNNKEGLYRVATQGNVLNFINQNREALEHAIQDGWRLTKASRASLTAFGALSFEVRRLGGGELFDRFLEGVTTGIGLQAGDPRLALRNWLSAGRGKGRSVSDVLQVYTRAWNYFAEGRTVQNMRLVGGEKPPRPQVPAHALLHAPSN